MTVPSTFGAEPTTPRVVSFRGANDGAAATRTLSDAGYRVLEAESADSAFELALELPDVLLIDIDSPDGVGLCHRLRQSAVTRAVPVIAVASSSAAMRAASLDGADAFLALPLEASVLIATVRTLVRLSSAERARVQGENERAHAEQVFVAALGHDLRNPLNVISLGCQVLAREQVPEPLRISTVTRMLSGTRRMERLIGQTVILAQSLGGQLPVNRRLIDLGELTSAVATDMQAGERIVCGGERSVAGAWDPERLTQLLDNLLGNALRYGEGTVTLTLSVHGNEVELSIHNHGQPITPELLPQLFDPFRRGKSRAGGAGFGLYIVDRIVRAHRGRMQVSSTESEGTTFAVHLPIEPLTAAQPS